MTIHLITPSTSEPECKAIFSAIFSAPYTAQSFMNLQYSVSFYIVSKKQIYSYQVYVYFSINNSYWLRGLQNDTWCFLVGVCCRTALASSRIYLKTEQNVYRTMSNIKQLYNHGLCGRGHSCSLMSEKVI